MRKVHIIRLEPSLPVMQAVNAFLVEGEKPVLIDSGYEESVGQLSTKLEEIGFKLNEISMIINTHEHIDHFGGNAIVKERAGSRIAAHEIAIPLIEDMKNQLPPEDKLKEMPDVIAEHARMRSSIYEKTKTAKVDIKLKDGDAVRVDESSLQVLHTPGHTPGHICLYERGSGTLFAGDMITGKGVPFVGGLHGDMVDFVRSLKRLNELKIDQAFLSHDGETRDAHGRINEILQRKLIEEQRLLEALKNGEKEFSELVDAVYPEKGFPYFTYGSTLAHLTKLRNEGKVRMVKKAGKFIVS